MRDGTRRAGSRRLRTRGAAAGVALGLGAAVAAPSVAQQAEAGTGSGQAEVGAYEVVTRAGGGTWRLDTRTGQVCMFEFPGSQPGAAVLNAGCFPMQPGEDGSEAGAIGRYEAAPHAKGELWRLDTVTGRVCLFAYAPIHKTSPVVLQGCSSQEQIGM